MEYHQITQFGIYFIACVGYGTSLLSLIHAIWSYIDHWRAYLGNVNLDQKDEAKKFKLGVINSITSAFLTVLILQFLQIGSR